MKWERDGHQQKQKRGHNEHLFYISGNRFNVSNSDNRSNIVFYSLFSHFLFFYSGKTYKYRYMYTKSGYYDGRKC